MMKLKLIAVATSGFLLSACASSPDQASRAAIPPSTQGLFESSPPKGLPSQRLEPGECGLFLWGQTPPHRFIFFSKAGSEAGLALIEEAPVELKYTAGGGAIFGEFNTATQYVSKDGAWSVSLEVEPGEMLEDGQRIKSGRMLQTDPEGWETILPVLGVRTCIPG